ncbi:unnamed protein product [Paramecium octaurelia]|uniref:Uncharacterized protein n=1 Tax=Paramecium octaurelia TaxID=43137 RepID=A0A8S1UH30_PAROT|nr:unnamed protein product [Paramecium octaurelia]
MKSLSASKYNHNYTTFTTPDKKSNKIKYTVHYETKR